MYTASCQEEGGARRACALDTLITGEPKAAFHNSKFF